MSKKSNVANQTGGVVPDGVPMDGRVIYNYQIKELEGRLLTFIESLGLREGQEKSAKDIFRDILYRSLFNETLWVRGGLIGPVVTKAYEEARSEGRPEGMSSLNYTKQPN